MIKYKKLTKDYLLEEYLNKKRSVREIADENGCTTATVRRKMKDFNIDLRDQKPKKRVGCRKNSLRHILTKEYLTKRFVEDQVSAREISEEVGCFISTVEKRINEYKLNAKYTRNNHEITFWLNVNKLDGVGCWEWLGAVTKLGYGTFYYKGRSELAHRISYAFTHGEIPENRCCLHRCDNPACVRPDHLYLGNMKANFADMVARGRNNPIRGNSRGGRHKLTEEQVKEIRRMFKEIDISYQELSKLYSVPKFIIQRIITGKTYRYAYDDLKLKKIIAVGPSRCGKDLFCDLMSSYTILRFNGTTSKYLTPFVAAKTNQSETRVYVERHKNRELWHKTGKEIRENDPLLLVNLALTNGELTGGVRDKIEIEAVRDSNAVDLVVWIERPGLPVDETLEFDSSYADIVLYNDGTVEDFFNKIRTLADFANLPLRYPNKKWG